VRRPSIRSVRFRITLAAAVAVAVVLGVAAVALVTNQRIQLTASLDDGLELRVDELEADVVGGPVDPASFAGSNDEDRLVQLVDESGTVVAGTTNVRAQPPIVDPPDEGQAYTSVDALPIEDDAFRVLARRIDTERGPEVLIVAENTDDLNDSVRTLTTSLGLAVPLAVLVLAAVVWWLVGRTLRPVEAIRRQVGDIDSAELDRRVPEPGTGDEIDRLALTMNAMLDRLEDGAARERRFVADTSHELRTPLTRMRTTLEVTDGTGDAAAATLASLHEEVIGLQRTVEELLVLATTDAAAGQPRVEPVDLDDIVVREVRRLRTADRVAVDMTAVTGAHLRGDPDQLGRLVRNLLDNGARHASSTVRVGCRERDGIVVLEVSDDGPGIDPSDRTRVFERFARLDPARSDEAGGTGLGLAIAREIVLAHGGTIVVDDAPDGGARFTVGLPAG
jgi:signal transduction histidine kinase